MGNLITRTAADNFSTSLSRLFDSFFNDSWLSLGDLVPEVGFSSYPRLNVKEDNDNLLVEASCPGLKQENISVEWSEGVLTISGESTNEKEDKDTRYLRRELHKSRFSRSLYVDEKLYDVNSIQADLKDGLLKVSIKKIPEVKPEVKKIDVKSS